MGTKSCVVVTVLAVLASLLSLSSAIAPPAPKPKFNITQILGKDPELSTFNSLLSQTGLAKEINTRNTITVLAVDNAAIGGLSGKPVDRIKDILSIHIILDYYDIAKLRQLSPKKNTTITTLFQSTGTATNQQGFLNIIALPNFGLDVVNKIRFASAVRGAPADVQLASSSELDYHKFDYVVLKVTGVIFTPGIDGWTAPPSTAPQKSPVSAPPPKKKSSTPTPSPDDEDDYDTPAPETAPPSETPTLSPAPSDAPSSDDAADDKTSNDTAAPPKSSASSISYLFTTLVMVFVSSFIAAASL